VSRCGGCGGGGAHDTNGRGTVTGAPPRPIHPASLGDQWRRRRSPRLLGALPPPPQPPPRATRRGSIDVLACLSTLRLVWLDELLPPLLVDPATPAAAAHRTLYATRSTVAALPYFIFDERFTWRECETSERKIEYFEWKVKKKAFLIVTDVARFDICSFEL